MNNKPLQILKNNFGYDSFREPQQEIINSILSGSTTLALLPTGQGKSLCFQIPGLIVNGYTLVISPLISLMQDQVQALEKRNISATFINSSLSDEGQNKRLQNIIENKYQFVYVAPERLLTKKFQKIIQQNEPSFLAIDEAHCFSMWGHDFRPKYRDIPIFISQLTDKPLVALFTATASKQVVEDLKNSFSIKSKSVFRGKFFRKNLFIEVKKFTNRTQKHFFFEWFVKQQLEQKNSGIIYAATREMTEKIAEIIEATAYHAGIDAEKKKQIQEDFIAGKIKIIVATNAFGMGIDKPNVRFVIHYQAPGNLENYAQEIGRAGRDQKNSHCVLLLHPKDLILQTRMIGINKQKHELFKIFSEYLEKQQCHHQKILQYFGAHGELLKNCKRCDLCLPFNSDVRFKKFRKNLKIIDHECSQRKIKLPGIVKQQLAILDKSTNPQSKKLIGVGEGLRRVLQYQA